MAFFYQPLSLTAYAEKGVSERESKNIYFFLLNPKLKTKPLQDMQLAPFFCKMGFKLKVQRFSQSELFEIVMMQGICHLVVDLYDVQQGCAPVFKLGRGKWEFEKRQRFYRPCLLCA